MWDANSRFCSGFTWSRRWPRRSMAFRGAWMRFDAASRSAVLRNAARPCLVRKPCRSHRSHPLVGEPVTGQRGDLLKVLVIMQHRGPVTFGDSADEQIGGGQSAVVAPPYGLLTQVECTGPRFVIAGQVVEA